MIASFVTGHNGCIAARKAKKRAIGLDAPKRLTAQEDLGGEYALRTEYTRFTMPLFNNPHGNFARETRSCPSTASEGLSLGRALVAARRLATGRSLSAQSSNKPAWEAHRSDVAQGL
jgi:hypothetical protein